jgi:phage shock protein E
MARLMQIHRASIVSSYEGTPMKTLSMSLFLALSLAACAQSIGTSRNVDVSTLQQALSSGDVAVLVDVRTPAEFAQGHVPGAILVPVDELSQRLAELEAWRSSEVYVICRSGSRSSHAAGLLADAGFQAVNVRGGTSAWTAAGFSLE